MKSEKSSMSSKKSSKSVKMVTEKILDFMEDDDDEFQDETRKLIKATVSRELSRASSRSIASCADFQDVETVARNFVSDILNSSAKSRHKIVTKLRFLPSPSTSSSSSSSETTSKNFLTTFSGWPTIEDFTEELGKEKIYEYLKTWSFEEDWLFEICLIHRYSTQVADCYMYQTIWSIPCKEYPVPQATASIFFTFEISRIKPRSCIVDVYYNFEGQRFRFTPNKQQFQEEWLFRIVQAKLKFFQTLRF